MNTVCATETNIFCVLLRRGESEEHRRKGPAIQLKTYHNTVKRALINRFTRGAAEVLDIASGQGGDLRKWVDAGVLRITGLDRAESEVAEATRRFQDMAAKGENWSHQRQTIGGQSSSQPLVAEDRVIDTIGKKELSLRDGFFDAITIMFAFHYFFEDFDTLGQVLSDVGRCLKPGGYFFGTMPDGQRVLDLLGDQCEPYATSSFAYRLFGQQLNSFDFHCALSGAKPSSGTGF
eukprot:SAG31_NODE_3831_length_3841_cov_2.450561_3_plen_234_part_00